MGIFPKYHTLLMKIPANKTLEQSCITLNGHVVTLMEIANEYLISFKGASMSDMWPLLKT